MSWFYWFLSFITQPVVELPKFCYEEVTTTTEGSVVLESGKEVAVAKEESVDNESSKKNNWSLELEILKTIYIFLVLERYTDMLCNIVDDLIEYQ